VKNKTESHLKTILGEKLFFANPLDWNAQRLLKTGLPDGLFSNQNSKFG
jgi:hypothetical protein